MNTIEITPFHELTDAVQGSVAEQVSDFTNARLGEDPRMLPVTPQQVMDKYAAFAAFNGDEFAGYIAANKLSSWQHGWMSEVGSLWVPKAVRAQGIAHQLVAIMTATVLKRSAVPYAFCNESSQPIFEQNGYTVAARTKLPPVSYSLCQICRYLPPTGCCNRPLIYDQTG